MYACVYACVDVYVHVCACAVFVFVVCMYVFVCVWVCAPELNNASLQHFSHDVRFYGGAAVSPSSDAEGAQRTSRSTEQSLMFDDLAYQAGIDQNPHLQHKDLCVHVCVCVL